MYIRVIVVLSVCTFSNVILQVLVLSQKTDKNSIQKVQVTKYANVHTYLHTYVLEVHRYDFYRYSDSRYKQICETNKSIYFKVTVAP